MADRFLIKVFALAPEALKSDLEALKSELND